MCDLGTVFQTKFLLDAKEKIDANFKALPSSFEDEDLSKLIFRGQLDNIDVINAHIQAIHTQLGKITGDESYYLKQKEIIIEFSKSITLFNKITNSLSIDAGVFGDNFIASQNFYLSAVSGFKKHVPNFYQGDMEFSCIPLKIRLAIEIYFKNTIGYVSSEQQYLSGHRKGETSPYPLSISDLLKFFNHEDYKKYLQLPPLIKIEVLRDINYWTNDLMHTGVISFAWQNLTAIDLLHPLFYTKHENGAIHVEGFNYLSPEHDLKALEVDLNAFLSNRTKKVCVKLLDIKDKPIEGAFYFPRKVKNA